MGIQISQGEGAILEVVRPVEKHGNQYFGVSGSKKNNLLRMAASSKAPACLV